MLVQRCLQVVKINPLEQCYFSAIYSPSLGMIRFHHGVDLWHLLFKDWLYVSQSGGLSLQQYNSGCQFWPNIKVRFRLWGHLATSPVVSDMALTHQLCRKEFPQRLKILKQIKCLLGWKENSYLWTGTEAGSKTESRFCGGLNHSYGAFLPGFLWPIILICLVQSLYLVYLRNLPCMCTHVLTKMDSNEEAYA